jgi:hypothetical protein
MQQTDNSTPTQQLLVLHASLPFCPDNRSSAGTLLFHLLPSSPVHGVAVAAVDDTVAKHRESKLMSVTSARDPEGTSQLVIVYAAIPVAELVGQSAIELPVVAITRLARPTD